MPVLLLYSATSLMIIIVQLLMIIMDLVIIPCQQCIATPLSVNKQLLNYC